jgi:hypothetical protein
MRAVRRRVGLTAVSPGHAKRPQQDSNLRTRLRRALIKMTLTSANTSRGPVPGG